MVKRMTRYWNPPQPETESDVPDDFHVATEVRSAAKSARSMRLFFEKARPIQVDDVLWFVCFALTMVILDVPNVLLFHHKVNCVIIFVHAIGLGLRIANRKHQAIKPVYAGLVALFGVIVATFFFSLAVWPIYNVWSIFIAFVTTMTYIAVISIV
uniref:Transmembrane protein n=1 Tax=Panagrellus redivivus TaxID=6233 RepID=A0A7E4W9V7_PANRE